MLGVIKEQTGQHRCLAPVEYRLCLEARDVGQQVDLGGSARHGDHGQQRYGLLRQPVEPAAQHLVDLVRHGLPDSVRIQPVLTAEQAHQLADEQRVTGRPGADRRDHLGAGLRP